jgi:UDP-GlcNAc:undecaprenyl-phosphate GlcNAc-1-phosphate transferase
MIHRLGALGMFVAFVGVIGTLGILQPGPISIEMMSRADKLLPLAVGATLMHIIGLADDFKPQAAWLKLVVQIVAAIIVVAAGYRFQGFGFREDSLANQYSTLSFVLSAGWIVGVANAINFIDGLDGLAGSLSFIAAFAFGIYYYQMGDVSSSMLCLSIAGVVVGFLFFNFPAPKAKIFMGDSGSLFLGVSLAVLPFLGQANRVSQAFPGPGLFPSITILALPVFDALRVILLRLQERKNIMSADRQHVHYCFADAGFSSLSVIGILDAAGVMLAITMLAASYMPRSLGYLLEMISIGLLFIFFRYARSIQVAHVNVKNR